MQRGGLKGCRKETLLQTHEKHFVLGAGIIGCSIALELAERGAQVTLVEQHAPLQQASIAAAGMLAAGDPHNPSELRSFSEYSLGLYDDFLDHIERYSHTRVAYQTSRTWQYTEGGSKDLLEEHSLDPRELARALHQAVLASPVELIEHASGFTPPATCKVIYAAGAWTGGLLNLPIRPAKGQMLRVALPQGLTLHEVHRGEHIYVVPRTHGPQAGTALIGATVEDAGFDTEIHLRDLELFRAQAAEFVPELASAAHAPMVEAWAGLRPATPDHLPLLGRLNNHTFIAAGHFRNGILLAPGTAKLVADLLEGKPPAIDLTAFAPGRFS